MQSSEKLTTTSTMIPDDPRFRVTLSQQLTSACCGALLTSLIVTPLDVVKIRLQTQQKSLLSNKCYLYCNGLMEHLCPCTDNMPNMQSTLTKNSHFTGTMDAFFKIARSEGIVSLWSGLSPTLILAVPSTMVYFVTYEQIRVSIKDMHKGVQPVWAPLLAGVIARMWAATIVSPIELIRTKMQSKKLSYVEIQEAIKGQFKQTGTAGLWRGLGPTLLRDVPFSGIYWFSYEGFKNKFSAGSPSFAVSFIGGALSGSIAATVTTPFDVVKTHQQIEVGEKEIFSDSPTRGSSMRTIIHKIYSQSGFRGLFTGLTPRLARIAPSCAIMISSFEYGKKFFYRYNTKELRTSHNL